MDQLSMHRASNTLFATMPCKTMADPPERTLALAVLAGAIHDLVKYSQHRGGEATQLYQEAQAWISSDDEKWIFSFVNLCALFGYPVDHLRRQLLGNPSAFLGSLRQFAA